MTQMTTRMRTPITTHLIALLTLAAWLTGCGEEKPAVHSAEASAPSYETAPAQFRAVAAEFTLPASVQPDPSSVVHVFAPVSGRLIALKAKTGDTVRAGQVVATIQSSDAASARSDYEKARAQAEHSQAALRRATVLYEHEVIAAKDVEDAKAQAASDKSDLARTQKRLELLGLSEGAAADKISVRAPRSGVVIETTSATGEFSKSLDASNPLMTIADLSSVWVVGNTYEKDLESIRRGAPVTVTTEAYSSQNWKGKIAYISDVVDANTRTIKVRVVLGNADHKLKPDMYAAIHISQPALRVAVVPPGALLHEGNEAFVIVQKDKDTFLKRTVQVQRSGPREVTLSAGLNQGDVIVTSGAELLREAAR